MKKRTIILILAAGLLRLLCCAQTAGKSEEYVLAAVWDEKTIGAKLTTPSGLALDKDGNLYVAGLWTVDKLSPEGKLVKRIIWKTVAPEGGSFPEEVALDSKGNFYVCTRGDEKIWVFSPQGELIRKWGEPGFREGKLDLLEAIAIDSKDRVYLGGGTKYGVQKFTTDGVFLGGLGNPVASILVKPGQRPGDFWIVEAIAIDNKDNVYISDHQNGRIQIFSPEGKFIRMWGKRGMGEEELRGGPLAVAVDAEGGVYVSEFGEYPGFRSSIKKFNPDGKYITKFGELEREYKRNIYSALSVDKKGFVHAADKRNDKIFIFKKRGEK